jgi:hypothetical protein
MIMQPIGIQNATVYLQTLLGYEQSISQAQTQITLWLERCNNDANDIVVFLDKNLAHILKSRLETLAAVMDAFMHASALLTLITISMDYASGILNMTHIDVTTDQTQFVKRLLDMECLLKKAMAHISPMDAAFSNFCFSSFEAAMSMGIKATQIAALNQTLDDCLLNLHALDQNQLTLLQLNMQVINHIKEVSLQFKNDTSLKKISSQLQYDARLLSKLEMSFKKKLTLIVQQVPGHSREISQGIDLSLKSSQKIVQHMTLD